MRVCVLLLGLLPSFGGCVVLPFASPPMKLSLSSGSSIGSTASPSGRTTFRRFALDFRGAVHPLQLLRNAPARRLDVGLGYFGNWRFGSTRAFNNRHGPYLELIYHPWLLMRGKPERPTVTRLALALSPELVLAEGGDAGALGAGLRMGVGIEWASFFHGPFSAVGGNGAVVGGGYGELGVGFQLDGGFRRIASEQSWTVGGSLVLRLPAAVGLLFGAR
jgi:hypothetical protein